MNIVSHHKLEVGYLQCLVFYGPAADRQEYCFTIIFFQSLFLNFNNFFSKSASKIHGGTLTLLFQKFC